MRSILSLLAVIVASMTLVFLAGCDSRPAAAPKNGEVKKHDHAGHVHGPHEGELIELGDEEYHAELLHDDATHAVTIYLLDAAAKEGVPVEETEITINAVVDGKPTQFKLPAAPIEGEPAGQSSRFIVADEKLHEAIESEEAQPRLTVTIAGKPYTGKIDHHHEQGKNDREEHKEGEHEGGRY